MLSQDAGPGLTPFPPELKCLSPTMGFAVLPHRALVTGFTALEHSLRSQETASGWLHGWSKEDFESR